MLVRYRRGPPLSPAYCFNGVLLRFDFSLLWFQWWRGLPHHFLMVCFNGALSCCFRFGAGVRCLLLLRRCLMACCVGVSPFDRLLALSISTTGSTLCIEMLSFISLDFGNDNNVFLFVILQTSRRMVSAPQVALSFICIPWFPAPSCRFHPRS